MLIVDAITGLGTTHLDMDGWGVDVLIGGSQKSVMMPPGLSYLAVSAARLGPHGGHLQSALLLRSAQGAQEREEGESAYTPSVALIAGLGAALDWIAAQAGRRQPCRQPGRGPQEAGRERRDHRRHDPRRRARAGHEALCARRPAAAATAVLPPEGTDSGLIVKELKSRFAAIVTDGQGEMKGQLFRIAHLGFFDYMDTIALIGALEQVAVEELPRHRRKFGDGLIAAQKVYRRAHADAAAEAKCLCGRTDACCAIEHPEFGAQ